jgi:hypothetical protein
MIPSSYKLETLEHSKLLLQVSCLKPGRIYLRKRGGLGISGKNVLYLLYHREHTVKFDQRKPDKQPLRLNLKFFVFKPSTKARPSPSLTRFRGRFGKNSLTDQKVAAFEKKDGRNYRLLPGARVKLL